MKAVMWVTAIIIISSVMFLAITNINYQKAINEKNQYCVNLSKQINEQVVNGTHLYEHCDCFFQNIIEQELLKKGVQPGCICNCLTTNGTMVSIYIGQAS